MTHKECTVMESSDCRDTTDRLIQRIIARVEAALISQRMAINRIVRRSGTKRIRPVCELDVLEWE